MCQVGSSSLLEVAVDLDSVLDGLGMGGGLGFAKTFGLSNKLDVAMRRTRWPTPAADSK